MAFDRLRGEPGLRFGLGCQRSAPDGHRDQVNLGGYGPHSGDGLEPTGIVLTTTQTPGS
jgi:hypothetical protein